MSSLSCVGSTSDAHRERFRKSILDYFHDRRFTICYADFGENFLQEKLKHAFKRAYSDVIHPSCER